MRSVVLYGEMGKKFGKHHRFEVRSAAEAIRALRANFPELDSFMAAREFRVFVGRGELGSAEDAKLPSGEAERIRIVPVIAGSKSGLFKAILGVALIAVAIVGAPLLGPLAGSVGLVGASMVIGGVSQILTKAPAAPDANQSSATSQSYIFSGPANTAGQGQAVTIVYGRMLVGSKVISAGIQTYDQ